MKPRWFKDVFGFKESGSFSKNQSKFKMVDGDILVSTANGRHHYVGRFEMLSVGELRARLAAPVAGAAAAAGDGGAAAAADAPAAGSRLTFAHYATPTGVGPMMLDVANNGAVFQAASQFNCLEMVGPGVTPARGIAIYFNDNTQGPKCALACPAGTVYRNYLVPMPDGSFGQGKSQLDGLAEVGEVVGNVDDCIWDMRNGYCMPRTTASMGRLGERLVSDPALAAAAESALRVGVHWSTSVERRASRGLALKKTSAAAGKEEEAAEREQRVCQVYASAVPVAYCKSTTSSDWQTFASLVLRGAYDATLAAAALISREQGGRRVKVFLTAIGGGAFGNRLAWVHSAIDAALDRYAAAPLGVYLVHYGTRVPSAGKAALPARL